MLIPMTVDDFAIAGARGAAALVEVGGGEMTASMAPMPTKGREPGAARPGSPPRRKPCASLARSQEAGCDSEKLLTPRPLEEPLRVSVEVVPVDGVAACQGLGALARKALGRSEGITAAASEERRYGEVASAPRSTEREEPLFLRSLLRRGPETGESPGPTWARVSMSSLSAPTVRRGSA